MEEQITLNLINTFSCTYNSDPQNKKSDDETKSPKVKTKIMNVKESKKQ